MKPLILIPLLLLSLGLVEAATIDMNGNRTDTTPQLVSGLFNITTVGPSMPINVSFGDGDPDTRWPEFCHLNFTSSNLNDSFNWTLTSNRSGWPNTTANETQFSLNDTLNWSTFRDASDWTVVGQCYNATGTGCTGGAAAGRDCGAKNNTENVTSTTFTVDNKAPNTPNGTTTTASAGAAFQISASVAANGTNDCVLWLIVDNVVAQYAMSVTTQNGTTCRSDSSFNIHSESTVSYFAEATDGTNKTNSSNQAITWTGVTAKRSGGGRAQLQPGVSQPGRADVVTTQPPSPPSSGKEKLLLGGIAAVFVFLIVVIVMSLRRH